jgi:hypothetical protein
MTMANPTLVEVVDTHIDCTIPPSVAMGYKMTDSVGGSIVWNPESVELYFPAHLQTQAKNGRWISVDKIEADLQERGAVVLNATVLDHILATPQLIARVRASWQGKVIGFFGTVYEHVRTKRPFVRFLIVRNENVAGIYLPFRDFDENFQIALYNCNKH